MTRNRGGNVVHRIELPRRRWPVRGRFELGWPVSAPPLASHVGTPDAAAPSVTAAPAARRSTPTERPPAPPPAAEPARSADEAEVQAKEHAYRREIDLLERRLRKVQGLLELREQELRRLFAAGKIDDGLRSIYTQVQGLDADSPMAETKREMMAAIFEANRELQARVKAMKKKKPASAGDSGRSGDVGAA